MPNNSALFNLSHPGTKKMLLDHVKGLTGEYWVTLRKAKVSRSQQQNAYFHGVVLPHTASGMTEAWGQPIDVFEAKEILRDRFLKKPIINKDTGEEVGFILQSTADLDKIAFSGLIERCIQFALDYLNVRIPSPDEYGF